MLAYTLEQQEERATQLARRGRIHQLLSAASGGDDQPGPLPGGGRDRFSSARTNTTGFLALWVEDEAGQ